jgi:hypothetical protein
MTIPILYTTTESIRATIGIDEDDVDDDALLQQNLEYQMQERLDEWLPTHATVYAATAEGYRRLTLWCQYFGALRVLEDNQLAIPQKIQANTDQMSRFTVDFEAMKADLRTRLVNIENKLNVPTTAVRFSVMGSSAAGYDPVTGA